MSLDSKALISKVTSVCKATGKFDRVNGHEPKNNPGKGRTAAVWVDRIRPVPSGSGLQATSGVVVLMCRLYTSMLSEPQDAIDPDLVSAADAILGTLSGDFDMGGTVRNVDLLGQSGFSLEAQAGYVRIDQTMYRVIDVTVPCIVNDIWSQSA